MLSMRQRHFDIGEREETLGLGDEVLTGHAAEYCQHALIQHVPGAHLLLDHLLAGIRQHGGTPIGLIAWR